MIIPPLGKNATVLEPAALKELMKHKIEELYQHYIKNK